MNKKGVADVSDPIFWGIVGVLWLVVLIAMWKMSIGSDTNVTKLKIMASVISLPIIAGISYLMGQNG
jgi:uncharacterized protein YqhQ